MHRKSCNLMVILLKNYTWCFSYLTYHGLSILKYRGTCIHMLSNGVFILKIFGDVMEKKIIYPSRLALWAFVKLKNKWFVLQFDGNQIQIYGHNYDDDDDDFLAVSRITASISLHTAESTFI